MLEVSRQNMASDFLPTLVVGAGWAGLATALALTRQGHPVVLLEAAPQAGGRARGISFGSDIVDNGQHLLMGAYTETLKLLEWLNISEDAVFDRKSFEWFMLNSQNAQKVIHLKAPSRVSHLKKLFIFLQCRVFPYKNALVSLCFIAKFFTKIFIFLKMFLYVHFYCTLNNQSLLSKNYGDRWHLLL